MNEKRSVHEKRSVLIVDQFDETREVLRTVLQRRGIEILEARRADRGLQLAKAHRPDVIVLDLETESAVTGSADVSGEFDRQARLSETSMVLLGSLSRDDCEPDGSRQGNRLGEYISKPYQYGPLVRRIEQLLQQRR